MRHDHLRHVQADSVRIDTAGSHGQFSEQGMQDALPAHGRELSASKRQEMLKIELAGHESYWTELSEADTTDGAAVAGALLGAFLIVPGLIDVGSGALLDWPKKISVVLPEKGRGSALAEIIR